MSVFIFSASLPQVTKRDWYDFFLVSQHVGQGTVSPTHYIVVHDNTGLKPDIIQKVNCTVKPNAVHFHPDQLQTDPHVLQLAGHSEGSGAMPIRSQACLPGLFLSVLCWNGKRHVKLFFRWGSTFTRSLVTS